MHPNRLLTAVKTLPRSLLLAGLAIVLAGAWLFLFVLPAARSQAAVLRADPEDIIANPLLRPVALKRGQVVFRSHCASCHGAAGKADPAVGVPDLTDGDYLYGEGLVAEIEQIARHGIRSGDKRGWHLASMPAYASPRPYKDEALPALTPVQINDITQFILSFQGHSTDAAASARGRGLYGNYAGCWDCHGHNAAGDPAIGAPSLTDDIWLYGDGTRDDIRRSIAAGRAGISPAFERSLSAADLRDVAVYTASLRLAGKNRSRHW